MAERSYRAFCPACGAPVKFHSAQSTHLVCGFCKNTLIRQGEILSRVGKMAELFDDHSPLQLMTTGRYQNQAFTLVGRKQYQSSAGVWTEWDALFDDGSTAWLSEDNGAYVFSRSFHLQNKLPEINQWILGRSVGINGQPYIVSFKGLVVLKAAEGEFKDLPSVNQSSILVELRSVATDDAIKNKSTQNLQSKVLSIDYHSNPPSVFVGYAVFLEDLKLQNLKDESVKNEKARQLDCPKCGSNITIQLESTQSFTCASCNSLIDIGQTIAGELHFALQEFPMRPLIPLGSVGKLEGLSWQIVGFQHRLGESQSDESYGWSEYLLYNRQRGFCFLVDAQDGWSLLRPATGVPQMKKRSAYITYLGREYKLDWAYKAETDFVCGEFYWHVYRGQKSENKDFVNGKSLLTWEKMNAEEVWSIGSRLDSRLVAKAFDMLERHQDFKRDTVLLSDVFFKTDDERNASEFTFIHVVWIGLVLVFLFVVESCSSDCDPKVENCSSRTSGGSWGGYTSGGGHK